MPRPEIRTPPTPWLLSLAQIREVIAEANRIMRETRQKHEALNRG